jgi:hypothetical protein
MVELAVVALVIGGCAKPGNSSSAWGLAGDDANLWVRYHFVGGRQIDADPEGTKFKELTRLPDAAALKQDLLQKLARAPKELFTQRINTAHIDRSPFFLPLLEDLLASESALEVRGLSSADLEYTLAVRLDDRQAELWSTNLWRVFQEWEAGAPTPLTLPEGRGWELKKHVAPNLFRLVYVKGWLVAALGHDRLPNLEAAVGRVTAGTVPLPTPAGPWLSVKADLTRLAPALGGATNLPQPVLDLAWSAKGESLRTTGKLGFAQPVAGPLPAWKIPTNQIREPLVSFSACRIAAPWLSKLEFVRHLGLHPVPDQFSVWSLDPVPFQSYLAFPSDRAPDVLNQLATALPQAMAARMPRASLGDPRWRSNRTEVAWAGLPFIMPSLKVVQEEASPFIVAGGFPSPTNTPALPRELLAQFIARPEVVYYQWELTEARLVQWRALSGLVRILSGTPPPASTNAPGQRWLTASLPMLRNAVTEVRMINPRTLEMTRSSQLGLTAVELETLMGWLDDPRFPLLGHQLPQNKPPAAAAARPGQ